METIRPDQQEVEAKKARVTKEYRRLRLLFKEVPEKKRRLIEGLVVEAAETRVTLEIWRRELDDEGWLEKFQQSEKVPPFDKRRAKAELFLSLQTNYLKIVNALKSYLPKETGNEIEDGFEEFVRRRD
jgi:hypothetical protein